MTDLVSTELIADTTDATTSSHFTEINRSITMYLSGALAGVEAITLQVLTPSDTYVNVTDRNGNLVELTASVTSFNIVGNGTFRLDKDSSASAAGAFYYFGAK